MDFKFMTKTAEKFVTENAPTLLSSAAIVGTVATAYLTGRASFKSAQRVASVDFKRLQSVDPADENTVKLITAVEGFKMSWPLFLPAVGTGALTIACIYEAHRVSASRLAAVAAAYSLSEKHLGDYKDKISEKFGIPAAKEVDQEIAKDRADKTPLTQTFIFNDEDVLIFDSHSGRYFKSSQEAVREAANEINFTVIHDNFATLGDFWEKIGLEPTAYSDEQGWTQMSLLELQWAPHISSSDKPCLLLSYDVERIGRWNRE